MSAHVLSSNAGAYSETLRSGITRRAPARGLTKGAGANPSRPHHRRDSCIPPMHSCSGRAVAGDVTADKTVPLAEQIGILGVHHVAVIVENLERSMAFYEGARITTRRATRLRSSSLTSAVLRTSTVWMLP